MKLTQLIANLETKQIIGSTDLEIANLVYDSRQVTADSLFLCVRGFAVDGHKFIGDAIEKGACALLVEVLPEESLLEQYVTEKKITFIQVEDMRKALALVSAAWFGEPAKKMKMIALTGTKGKSTTAFLVKRILEEAGEKVGLIGTVGSFIGEEKYDTENTTPESYQLHGLFAKMLAAGCTYVVMEASSQGMLLKRTYGIRFDYTAFLNLSPDHIGPNEHADFADYRNCKKLLFDQTPVAVANKDNEHWDYVTQAAPKRVTVSVAGKELDGDSADLTAFDVKSVWEGALFGSTFSTRGIYNDSFTVNMPGEFNVYNALIAMALAGEMGIDVAAVKRALLTVKVAGRCQLIPEAAHIGTFIIDYAHNALSTESLLTMLKAYNPHRLIVIFGCGGNRASSRRYEMGEVAGKYADLTIVTMDNPRFEDIKDINAQIVEGLNIHHGQYVIREDRGEAIRYAVENCQKDDIVAIIGKGHEDYMIVGDKRYHFSDEETLKSLL